MGAHNGNNGNVGKAGRSGRKSKYQEEVDFDLLHSMFFNDNTVEELEEKIATGKYSLKNVFIQKAYKGEVKILIEIFKKLFPDSMIVNSAGAHTFDLDKKTKEEIKKVLQKIKIIQNPITK